MESVRKEIKNKKRTFSWSITYVNKWKCSFCLIVFFFCLHFCLLSHFKIIRCIVKSVIANSTYFLLKCNWENKTWKVFFGRQSLGHPKQYTGLSNGLDTSLKVYTSYQLLDTTTSSFISCYFISASSADIFFRTLFNFYISEKIFFPLLRDSPYPYSPHSQNPLNVTKVFCQCC